MASSPAPLIIRPESPADHVAIGCVVAAAFGKQIEADLVDRIRASPEYVPGMALVAELDGAIVGHVMISHAVIRSADGDRRIAMLSPLAVDPAHQRRGIGRALVEKALGIADSLGEPIVILEGSPLYYGPLGFGPATRYGIEIPLPSWAPPEAAQVKLLTSFDPDDQTLRGKVSYPPAFDGLE